MNYSYINHKSLTIFLNSLFDKVGVSEDVCSLIVDGLVETSLRGVDSHGIKLVPHYLKSFSNGRINKEPKFKFIKKNKSTCLLDADNGHGIQVGLYAMSQAIKMATETGIGAVAVENSTHFGAAALYSTLAAKNDMIGLSFTNSDSLVIPYGGKKSFLGTNPICFAAPCKGEEPFCLDMATSTIAWNKVLVAKIDKTKLGDGVACDINGVETTNADEAVSLLPLGGYKGYGLGLMVEILCSMLTGMQFGPYVSKMYPASSEKRGLGHFFIAINIKMFQTVEVFKNRLQEMLKCLRSQDVAHGFSGILVAGDKEKKMYEERIVSGIPLTDSLIKSFNDLAIEFEVESLKNFN